MWIFPAALRIVVLMVLLSWGANASALQLDTCRDGRILLQPWLQIHEDPQGSYTLDDFLSLSAHELEARASGHLRPGHGGAAMWLRFNLTNGTDRACRLWLFPGASRARDMRLFRQHGDQWQLSVAGPSWPLEQWESPLRLPAFELEVPPGQTRSFVLRMGNNPGLAMQPMLLSHDRLLHERMAESTADGVVFGIVGLLVLLSLAIGSIYRLPLLFAHGCFFWIGKLIITGGDKPSCGGHPAQVLILFPWIQGDYHADQYRTRAPEPFLSLAQSAPALSGLGQPGRSSADTYPWRAGACPGLGSAGAAVV